MRVDINNICSYALRHLNSAYELQMEHIVKPKGFYQPIFNCCISAPPGPPAIRSESGKLLMDYTEPVTEGGSLTMICETMGGDPLPRVSWWRGSRLIDDIVDEVDNKLSRVRNSLRIVNLQRKDQGERITCKASNTNLTEPVETYISINMVCKYLSTLFSRYLLLEFSSQHVGT